MPAQLVSNINLMENQPVVPTPRRVIESDGILPATIALAETLHANGFFHVASFYVLSLIKNRRNLHGVRAAAWPRPFGVRLLPFGAALHLPLG